MPALHLFSASYTFAVPQYSVQSLYVIAGEKKMERGKKREKSYFLFFSLISFPLFFFLSKTVSELHAVWVCHFQIF